MKTLKIKNYLAILIILFAFRPLRSQPVDYPPQNPDPISSCQVDANCTLGSSLENYKKAVGLIYYKQDYTPKISLYKGSIFIIRQAQFSGYCCGGTILMTAVHNISLPYDKNWVRYKYLSTCGGPNPTTVSGWVDFNNNVLGQININDLQAFNININYGQLTQDVLPVLGWSLLDPSTGSAKSLGHPKGNDQKVTSYNNLYKTVDSGYNVWGMSINGGYLEVGQSGSPLFNSSNYVIGVLRSTSNTNCSGSTPSGTAYALRLSKYYRTFSEYLDPNHSGAVQVPTWIYNNGNPIEIGEYKYPSLSKTLSTLCSGNVGYVSINNYCEFMDDNVEWTVSNPSLVNVVESSDQKTLQISPKTSSSSGNIIITATIDFGGWQKSYTTSMQIGKVNSSQVSISGPSLACPNDYIYLSCNYIEGVDNYDWDWGSSFQYFGGDGTRYLDLKASYNFQGDAVLLKTHNTCGWWTGTPTVKYIAKNYSCSYYYALSPNPSINNEVTIEVIPDKEILESEPEFTMEFDVQIIDSQKNKIKEYKKVKNKLTIDTKNLESGKIYFLIITDKYKSETKKLLVN